MTPKAIRALVDDLATQQYETSQLLPDWIDDLGTPNSCYLAHDFAVLDCVDREFRFWSDGVAKALASIRPTRLFDCTSNYFNDGSRQFIRGLSQGFEFKDGSVAIYHCVPLFGNDFETRYYHAPSAAHFNEHPVARLLPALDDNRLWVVDSSMSSVAFLSDHESPLIDDPAFRKWLITAGPECFLGLGLWHEDEVVYSLRTCPIPDEVLAFAQESGIDFNMRLWAEYWLCALTDKDAKQRRMLLEDLYQGDDSSNIQQILDTYNTTIALVGEGLADGHGNVDMAAIAAIQTSMRAVFEQLGYLPPNSEHEPLLFGINNPQAV